MTKHNYTRLIMDLTEALNGSVPERKHNDALAALRRSQEMIANLANTVCSLDASGSYKELVSEASLYANILSGVLGESGIRADGWVDITKGYDPHRHLANKGVIPKPKTTRELMEEKWQADRKAQQAEIDRLIAEHDRKRNARKVSATTMALIKAGAPKHLLKDAFVQPLIEPSAKRGRPVGSKNKSKEVIDLPTLEESPGKKVGILKRIKKAQAASTKKGGRK